MPPDAGPPLPIPAEPETLVQTGLPESLVEQLVLKILYFRGDLYGQDLSNAIGLRYSVISDIIESYKLRHQIVVKRSMGMGTVGALLSLTDTGRERAREFLESNQYSGTAPVPLSQYCELVKQQRHREGWLTREALARAFRGMVITERVIAQVGPAVSSATTLLLYGRPGDGKTFLIESLNNLDDHAIFLPHALECQGNIIQVYDPIFHHKVDDDPPPQPATSVVERSYDRRWLRCKRPFIVSGGELSMDMLDLRYNSSSRLYQAPFQLKANNGMYLIDDFGRQRATPTEVLNRWIVPMERHIDYLSFLTGGKMSVPFECFLIFSTNINPNDLGDEAFLRRIQYKMLMRGPSQNEFIRIFESFCASRKLPYSRDVVVRFIERRFKALKRPLRRCQPRDILTHALNLIHFERLPYGLTDQLLDRAFESCFVQDEDQEIIESPILPVMSQSCADSWGDRMAQIPTAFGTLMFAGSYRDRASDDYHDVESARQFGETETARVLRRQHGRAYHEWMALSLEQQTRDFGRYLAADGANVKLPSEPRELAAILAPGDTRTAELQILAQNLAAILDTVCPKPVVPAPSPEEPEQPEASRIERIA